MLAWGIGLALSAALAPVHAGAASWWEPLAFAGQRVDSVDVAGGVLTVRVGDTLHSSTDGGHSFPPAPARPPRPGLSAPAAIVSGGHAWAIRDGTVLTGPSPAALRPDPGAPALGAAAHLIAAPAALPGVVVAVGTDGHAWRRGRDGRWATSLVLLPAGGVSGVPRVTGLQAFTQPLSGAVYVGTDGYGVLLSSDGGDDWIRADPGLPSNVLGLATDPARRSLYAATADGLWVHVLQSFPAPPAYADAQLWLRWLGIGAVAAVTVLLAGSALRLLLGPTHQRGS